jgi:oligoendopeptidase F
MHRNIMRAALALLLLFALGPVRAQEEFTPVPKELVPKYRFDFARNFFATPEAEKKARPAFNTALKKLESYKGKVTASPDNLYNTLSLYDEVVSKFMRHYVYLYLRYAVNTKDTESRDAQDKFGAELNQRTSFIQQEVMRLDDKTLQQFTAKKPQLKQYAYAIQNARRLKPHTLSLKEEEMLSATEPLMTQWVGQLYQKGLDRTQFGKVPAAGAELDVWKQQSTMRNSPDRTVREAGFKKLYTGYEQHRDLYAFAMTKLVGARNEISRMRKYKDNPSEAYFKLYLTTAEVKGLFDKLAKSAGINKTYQRLRAERIKKIAGYDEVNAWDLSVIPPGMQRPRFTITEATEVIKAALKPFGSEYGRELDTLLNPASGRLDIVSGENRVPGAFAWGFPGSQVSIFYSFNYEGFFDDVSTLAHEAGHAVHMQLEGNNHVLPAYTDGPNYFTESFAMFNELLLADHLYKKETDPQRKTFFLERFLDQAVATFPVARQAALEQKMYEGVESGKLKTADDFDKLARENGALYSIWFEKHPEMKNEWIDVHHYYDSPMYYVNYVFAQMLALKYYQMYTQNPQQFVPKYLALMRNGFNAPPTTLLKKFLNLDLKDPNFVSDALSVVTPRLKELEELYGRS